MGILIAGACFAALIALVLIGRAGMVREYDRRVSDWARKEGLTLLRVDRDLQVATNGRPLWRVRVRTRSGDTRDAILRGGWSIHDDVDVQWSDPRQSAFR